jgi:ubiquinone/menaquinone biosynthesis C-methylase UbiE
MFSDPSKIVEQFGLLPGMHVADFGAGSGFYTFASSKIVGGQGKVFAVDIQKDLLLKLKSEAKQKHLLNVEVVWADLEKLGGSKFNDHSVDAVITANILFQLQEKEIFAQEIKRILKPNGRVLLIDWKDSFGGLGPHPMDLVSPEEAKIIFEKEGFKLERSVSDAGAHHYGLIFKKI